MTRTVIDDAEVHAAGGVVLDDQGRVLVVHRPAYDDWSLPKGKLDPGEAWQDAAVREILEETGVVARLGAELTPTRYPDRKGRPKLVRWWSMTAVEAHPRDPDDEVDQVRWVAPGEAGFRLTYPTDRALVDEARARTRRAVLLVRHAHAGDRAAWNGDDGQRPLSDRGRRQADGLVATLSPWQVDRVLSSPLTRCMQTIQPLADHHGLDVVGDHRLAEGARLDDVWALLADVPSGTVLCSHGDVIGGLVEDVAAGGPADASAGWPKGSTWVLTLDGDRRATAAQLLGSPS